MGNSRAVALWKQFTLGINFYFSSVLSIPLSKSTARKRLITPRCTVFKKYQSEHRMSLLASLQRLYHVHVTGIPKYSRVHFNSNTNTIEMILFRLFSKSIIPTYLPALTPLLVETLIGLIG